MTKPLRLSFPARLLVIAITVSAVPMGANLAARAAEQSPEDVVFGLYLAKAGAEACAFTFSDSDKAALDRELAARIVEARLSAAQAQQIDTRARDSVADHKAKDPKLCVADGEFYGLVRELFDASADRQQHR